MTQTDFQLAGSFDDSWPPFAAAGAVRDDSWPPFARSLRLTDDSWPPL